MDVLTAQGIMPKEIRQFAPMELDNIGGDLQALVILTVFWTMALIGVETGLFSFVERLLPQKV